MNSSAELTAGGDGNVRTELQGWREKVLGETAGTGRPIGGSVET